MTWEELDRIALKEGGLILRAHADTRNEVLCAVLLKPDSLIILGRFGRDERTWTELETMRTNLSKS